jgi:hypothetical protein
MRKLLVLMNKFIIYLHVSDGFVGVYYGKMCPLLHFKYVQFISSTLIVEPWVTEKVTIFPKGAKLFWYISWYSQQVSYLRSMFIAVLVHSYGYQTQGSG